MARLTARAAAATALAGAFLAGEWHPDAMARRGKRALGDRRRWLADLARVVFHAYRERPADRPRELARFVDACDLFDTASRDPDRPLQVRVWMAAPTEMAPPPWPPRRFPWPVLHGVPDLAAWLGVTDAHLEWFADRRSFERTASDERLRHYRRRWVAKADGSSRLIEAPKHELKDLQRQVLHGILDRAPKDWAQASGSVGSGRSLHDFAELHVGKQVVIRCDLEAFFASTTVGRVYGVFRWLGYPEPVAHHLAALCTTVTPRAVLRSAPRSASERHRRALTRLAGPHLPQGAPTSSSLAGLCMFRLDRRLYQLARGFEGRYSRYVDDLIFSGDADLLRGSRRFVRLVESIVRDEGYRLHAGKTRIRTAAQRQTVTGLVVNAGLNVPRREYDQLRAVLHDAARSGPEAANRAGHHDFRAHLQGRITWVAAGNPTRAAKLHAAFAAIPWPDHPTGSRGSEGGDRLGEDADRGL